MDPQALTELIPDGKEKGAPLNTEVTEDKFLFLTEKGARSTPNWLLPECFQNHGNYIVQLGNVVRWMGEQADALGVDLFPGFAAAAILYPATGAVQDGATADMGGSTDGKQPQNSQHAKE